MEARTAGVAPGASSSEAKALQMFVRLVIPFSLTERDCQDNNESRTRRIISMSLSN